jgi:NTE family protein
MPSPTASHPVGRNGSPLDQSLKSFQGQATRRIPRPERCGRIAPVLQGGGALGAYQAGVYQALQEAGLEPDWVSGVSIGAINVLDGNFAYFDNALDTIEPAHVMASGALPPALPMVKIGTDHFWDGGIVSNTPLQHLLDQDDCVNTLVFQVDLFSAHGALPRDIQDVMARHKDIVYSSRTRYNTDVYRRIHTWKTRLRDALQKVPVDRLTDEERRLKDELADLPEIAILQLIYQQKSYEGHAKDYEFSGTSMREYWTSGYEDTMRTLKHRHWIAMPLEGDGIVVHDVHREE